MAIFLITSKNKGISIMFTRPFTRQAKKVIEIMEQAVTLEVPNKVDYEVGNNWGEING